MRWLLEQGAVVICAGGGGIPTMYARDAERQLVGVEAVIDKDLATSLLARELEADLFVMATDVDGVYRDWGQPTQARIRPGDAGRTRRDGPAGRLDGTEGRGRDRVRHGDRQAGRDRLARRHRRARRRHRRHPSHGGNRRDDLARCALGGRQAPDRHRPPARAQPQAADPGQPRRAAVRRRPVGRARAVGARPVREPHARARRRGPVRAGPARRGAGGQRGRAPAAHLRSSRPRRSSGRAWSRTSGPPCTPCRRTRWPGTSSAG